MSKAGAEPARLWKTSRVSNDRAHNSATWIGIHVGSIPCRDGGSARCLDDEEQKLRVCGKVAHLNVHVLNRSQLADRAPSATCGIEAWSGARGFGYEASTCVGCCRF